MSETGENTEASTSDSAVTTDLFDLNQSPFDLQTWPGLGSGNHSGATTKHHEWLRNITAI